MADDSSWKRPNRRRRVIVTLLVGVMVIGAWWLYGLVTQTLRMVAAIEAAGGRAYASNHTPFAQRMLKILFGEGDPQALYTVWLKGPKFDDAWLAEHDDLQALRIDELIINDCAISPAAAMRLFETHPVHNIVVPGLALTDADARVVGARQGLVSVTIKESQITDAGLALLRPQRLGMLNVAGAPITSAALEQQLPGSQVAFLTVDGRQFSAELAAVLSHATKVRMLTLAGPDVTDEHLQRLETMSGRVSIKLDQTSASEAAIAALRAARAPAEVHVLDVRKSLARRRSDSRADVTPPDEAK